MVYKIILSDIAWPNGTTVRKKHYFRPVRQNTLLLWTILVGQFKKKTL